MTRPTLRIGTRASALALWQANTVRAALAAQGTESALVEITTTGDGIQDRPLSGIGDTALFTRQLDEALLDGRVDLAVHSLKDLPSRIPQGLALVAVSEREDPRDALVARDGLCWATLPTGATVATGSVRRRAQLAWRRPDLVVTDIRGNLDTRLAKLDANPRWAATMLACAGLVRLGWAHRISERLDPDVMLSAPGQGALGMVCHAERDDVRALVRRAMHDPATGVAVLAERALLGALDGGCQVPIAALGRVDHGTLHFLARVLSHDGSTCLEESHTQSIDLSDPEGAEAKAAALGRHAAERLRTRGAESVLATARAAAESGYPP